MTEALTSIVQALTILIGAVFGFVGILSKREDGPLKRSDQVALGGIVVAGVLALASLGIEVVRKADERNAELARVADEVRRQGQLLQEVQRTQRAISQFGLDVDFSVSAKHPALAPLVSRWESFIASAKKSEFDDVGYSRDGTLFVARNNKGNVETLYVNPDSALFPKNNSAEFRLLLPTLSVALLTPNAPVPETLGTELSLFSKKYIDLSLFFPLGLTNYKSRERTKGISKADSKVFARLIYNRKKSVIQVSGSVSPATATFDTGAIVSLLDLPGRQLVLVGLKQANVTSVDTVELTASTGTGRFWSGHKEIRPPALRTFSQGENIFAAYQLKNDDFTGLATLREKPDVSKSK
jgi:hypothetical protein